MTVSTRLRIGGFSPSKLPGLVLWLQADAITGLVDGDPVATWPDSSSSVWDATQGSGGNRPTWETGVLNGKPVVRFVAASSHYLRVDAMGATFSGTDKAISVVVVFKNADIAAPYTLLGMGNQTDGDPFEIYWTSGNNYQAYRTDNSGALATAFASGNDSSPHVVSYIVPGTTIGIWEDGAVIVAAGAAFDVGGITHDRVCVGARNTGGTVQNHHNGDIAELLVYSRALTTDERQQLERHLGAKYGLTVA